MDTSEQLIENIPETHSTMEIENSAEGEETRAFILCCLCGVDILPNAANMCKQCLVNEVDVTKNINRSFVILQCRSCKRYLKMTKWIKCDLESKELLALCLKKIKNLQKLKLVDAKFIWTEPHSKRLKVKVTVQADALNNTVVQQSFMVEFSVENQQCDFCQKSYTENTWKACVQIRQRVSHKRTFFYLEQLILKNGLGKNITGMKNVPGGLNFYFESKSHALALVEFVVSAIPVRHKNSKRLVSQDFKSNLTNFKYTAFVEIAPVCREDLVYISSRKYQNKLGGHSPLMLCTKVTNKLYFVDPFTLHPVAFSAAEYFADQFKALCSSSSLVEFFIIDIVFVKAPTKSDKLQLARVECVRSGEINHPESYVEVYSHLGNLLRPGDSCLGYDMRTQNIDESIEHKISNSKYSNQGMPKVVLVRKVYDRKAPRNWKLRRLALENAEMKFEDDFDQTGDEETDFENYTSPTQKTRPGVGCSKSSKRKTKNAKRESMRQNNESKRKKTVSKKLRDEADDEDEERFLEELELNKDLRSNVNLWRDGERHLRKLERDGKALEDGVDPNEVMDSELLDESDDKDMMIN